MLSLLSASIKPSTKAVYRQAYSNYKHFHTLFYPNLTVFPIDSLRIAKFISFSIIQGNKSSTIQTHIAGLNYFHKILGLKNPCDHFIVKKLLQGSRNLHSSPDKRLPITLTILQGLVNSIESLGLSQYDCFLYRAMFLTAFFALLRVGEMTLTEYGSHNIILFENVVFNSRKSKLSSVYITLYNYKHSNGSRSTLKLRTSKQTHLCPVSALFAYVGRRGQHLGPLFITSKKLPIHSKHFGYIFRQCIEMLGLDPSLYTPHSLVIGGATLANQLNFSETQLKSLGRWRSSAYTKYIRTPGLLQKL